MDSNNSNSGEISPVSYLKIFFRRKALLIIPVFAGLIVGICAGIVMPKKYVSSTVLLVEEGKTDNPLFNQLAVATTVQQRITTIREAMLGWNSLVELVKRLELEKDIKTPRQLESLIMKIRGNILIRMRDRNIINISYFGETPEISQDVVKNITQIFVERNIQIQNRETTDAINFIEEQLRVYRGKIKSSEIAKLKDQLNLLLLDSTEEHPQVIQLHDAIAAKEKELEEENLEYTKDMKLDSNTTNPLIQEIKRALGTLEGGAGIGVTPAEPTNNDFSKVMLINQLDRVMARDVGVNNQIYNMLLSRVETAKITQRLQSSKEGTRYTILDPPRLPLRPIKPNKFLVAMGGLVGGLLLGIGLVIGFEFLDQSFIDVEEAKQYLGIPLLGAISKINTESSVKAENEKLRWLYGMVLMGGVVTVILTITVSNFLA